MFTWTENPISEIWKQLKFISYRENCRNLLIGKISSGRSLIFDAADASLERKVIEVSMCIQQGIEYFCAANQVTLNTSPLLVYYGMLSLAKAVIVANANNLFIDDIEYHGLSAKPNNEMLKEFRRNKSNWCIENEFAIVNGGVFNELNNVLAPDSVLPTKSIIRVKDCLSCIPEIKELYEKYYGEHANSFDMYDELRQCQRDPSKIEFAVGPGENSEILFKYVPEIADNFNHYTEKMHGIAPYFCSKNNMAKESIDYFANYCSCVGGRYFLCGLKYELNGHIEKKIIDQALIDYILLFILGEQVRYHQDFWGEMVQGEKSGTLGLLDVYLDIVKRRYPNEILNKLFGERFTYGMPARFV